MTEPVKFVVTGLGRCGSNLMKFSLRHHPAVKMTGEYFNPRVYPESVDVSGSKRAAQYFQDVGPEDKAVGFKIFIHQANNKPARRIWIYLKKENVSIIHLSRRNLLERIISLTIASQSGLWISKEEKDTDIRIDKPGEWWLEQFMKDEKKEQKLEDMFSHKHYLRVYYEDLIQDWDSAMGDVQAFLGVPVLALRQYTKKQETLPPRERCTNYDELRSQFQSTKYAWMFETG